MAYIDPKTGQPVTLPGDAGQQNLQANQLGYNYQPDTAAIPATLLTSNPTPITVQTPATVPVPPVPTPAETTTPPPAPVDQNPFNRRLEDLIGKMETKPIETQKAVEGATYLDTNALNEINRQIREHQVNAVANQEAAARAGETTGFASREQQNVARTDAIQGMRLSILSEGLQGNIALATKRAQMAVDAEFAQTEKDIQTARANIIANYDGFTPAEKKRADALLARLDSKDAFVAEQKTNREEIYKTAMTAAQNAGSFIKTPEFPTVAVALDAISKAPTKEEALRIATVSGLVQQKNLPASAEEYNFAVQHGYKGTYTQYQNEDANRKLGIASTNKPLDILDVQRYQQLYPDASINAGDTVATANAKVAALNSPEAKLRSMVVAAQTNGNTYDTVVNEINNDPTIKDKQSALAVAKEVYGVTETAPSKIENDIANIRARYSNLPQGVNQDDIVKRELANMGYSNQDIIDSSVGGTLDKFITGISKALFGK